MKKIINVVNAKFASIEATIFVLFVSIVSWALFKPDLTTQDICVQHYHQQGNILKLEGRSISYYEFGPKEGHPVIHFPSVPGSRLLNHPDVDAIAKKLNIRLFILDLPGIGKSDYKHGRTISNSENDVKFLVNHLNLNLFSLSGHGLGAHHALYVAHSFKSQVRKVSLIGGIIFPPQGNDKEYVWKGMKASYKLVYYLSKEQSWALSLIWKMASGQFVDVNSTIAKEEKKYIKSREFEDHLYHGLTETFCQGTQTLYDEINLSTNPWNFDIKEINVPVNIWYSKSDQHSTEAMANYLNDNLPNSVIIPLENEGHYTLWLNHFEEIMAKTVNNQ